MQVRERIGRSGAGGVTSQKASVNAKGFRKVLETREVTWLGRLDRKLAR